jgi:hypothetical protein
MRSFFVVMVLVASSIACGKSEVEKQAEEAVKAAEEVAKAAEDAAKAVEAASKDGSAVDSADMAKAMQGFAAALSGTGADGKPVEPIAFQTLQTHLPKVSGWEMDEPEGQRMTMPVPFSQVETEYRNGDKRIDVTIVDTGFAKLLVAPWSMMLAAGYSNETSDGYEKAITVAGNPAVEKWSTREKNGELNILVGKRFMVTLDGNDIADVKELHTFASQMDLSAIAALK